MRRRPELSFSPPDPTISDEHGELSCITCGDVAVEARVVALDRGNALVELSGRREKVAVDLVEGVAVGDVVLCHAGVALEKLESPPRELESDGR
ncbi:MAG: HypC/HybG/HupF family hydrogenase formation chaperone [Actinobacteria bacterium]|nr:HypC/HybG/HupF family hydrogenase formation chaperone [Actinomycetota bacterium]